MRIKTSTVLTGDVGATLFTASDNITLSLNEHDNQAELQIATVAGGGPTIFVAASNAHANTIAATKSSYRCTGTGDEAVIQAAIDAIPVGSGGTVQLSEGKFTVSDTIRVYRDGVTIKGGGSGTPAGAGASTYATSPVTSGTLIRPATGFTAPYVLDCRVTGNVVTTVAANTSSGSTTLQLASVTGLPTSGVTYLAVRTRKGGNVWFSYNGISGATLQNVSGLTQDVAAGALVDYMVRSQDNEDNGCLEGITLVDFSIDATSSHIATSGIFFQAWRSNMTRVKVSRMGVNGIVVDGGGHAWGFDNQLTDVEVSDCLNDNVQQVMGASDNIWTGLISGDAGRYGFYNESSPGTIVQGGHIYRAGAKGVYGDARQFKLIGVRVTDNYQGGVYLTALGTQGMSFNITGCSFRNNSKSSANTYDNVNISPSTDGTYGGAQYGGLIGPNDHGQNDDDTSVARYCVNIENSNANHVVVSEQAYGYNDTATKAYGTAALNDAGTGTRWSQPKALLALTDAATVTVDATRADYFTLSAGGSRTIAAPTGMQKGWLVTFDVLNNTGGAITTTWNAAYKMAGWTDPAAGKRRTVTFRNVGTAGSPSLVQVGPPSADI